MKTYQVTIRWRSYRWTIQGLAKDSCSLVSGLLQYFGPGAFITVKAMPK